MVEEFHNSWNSLKIFGYLGLIFTSPFSTQTKKKKTLRKVMQYFSIANKTTENFFKKSINSINDHKKVLNVWHVL